MNVHKNYTKTQPLFKKRCQLQCSKTFYMIYDCVACWASLRNKAIQANLTAQLKNPGYFGKFWATIAKNPYMTS